MKQENRHQAILYAVMRQGYVSIESLAEELGVSSQTIRRDISELDRTGMLERRPGGASCRTTILNSTYDARQVEDFKDKERIARTIAEYIPALTYISILRTHENGVYKTYIGNPFYDELRNINDETDTKNWRKVMK